MAIILVLSLITQLINIESRNFYAYSYDEIILKLEKWESEHEDIFKLYTAKEKYNLYFDGNNMKCSTRYGSCEHHIIIITNHATWNNDLSRPHVFFSGALHGDERVGPTTLIELCEYLLFEYKNNDNNEWINYLINNRVIILTPMTNAIGYALSKREEKTSLDPNRDFPYMITNSENCMKTIVGRLINEIFREYLIQLAITFHGGMRAISYEWGAPNHNKPNDYSPDHIAQLEMTFNMQILGGHINENNNKYYYPIGTLNRVVYPVKGGMEDWAYAGSWDKEHVIQCTPNTYNTYPKEKTIYNNAMLRAFNFLIEASDMKTPKAKWGSIKNNWNDIWDIDNHELDGHIPRNIRISMFLINCVMPYVIIEKYPKIIPYNPIKNVFSDEKNKKIKVINWFVSGIMSIYEYDLLFAIRHNDDNNMHNDDNNMHNDGIKWEVLQFRKNEMWRKNLDLTMGYHYQSSNNKKYKFKIDIESKLTIELMKQIVSKCQQTNSLVKTEGDKLYCPIWFSIRAKVDDQWKTNRNLSNFKIIKTFPEGMGPQSHIVNARNMDQTQWNMTNNKYFVKASEWWYAIKEINIDIYFIYDDKNKDIITQYSDKTEQTQHEEEVIDSKSSNNLVSLQFIILFLCIIGIIIFLYKRKKSKHRRIYNDKTYQRVPTISIV